MRVLRIQTGAAGPHPSSCWRVLVSSGRAIGLANSPRVAVTTVEGIAGHIYVTRGEQVMVDSDLATLYGVPTSALNQAVTRNAERSPKDFAFKLSPEE